MDILTELDYSTYREVLKSFFLEFWFQSFTTFSFIYILLYVKRMEQRVEDVIRFYDESDSEENDTDRIEKLEEQVRLLEEKVFSESEDEESEYVEEEEQERDSGSDEETVV